MASFAMARWRSEHPDPERLQQRTVRVLVAAQVSGGAAIGVGAAVSPLLAKEILGGMVLIGSGTAANLLARYAGADLATPEHRARAISAVVWATTIGAVAGPNALGPAGRLADWLELPSLAGPFLVAFVWFAVAAAVIGLLLRPDPLVVAGGLETARAPASRRSALGELRLHATREHPREPPRDDTRADYREGRSPWDPAHGSGRNVT